MKGKFHTEEAVLPILQRKGIIVNQLSSYDADGNSSQIKEIGIPLNVHPGLRILGKLDFMKKMGWKILKLSEMTENLPRQKKTDTKDKKEPFFKKKKVINKMKN